MKKVLVTGGNAGIGLALCRQLAVNHGCHVLLGARSKERGSAVVASILDQANTKVDLVLIDTACDVSVLAAAAMVEASLDTPLYAVVNNAGAGLAQGVAASAMVNTNLYGPRRVSEAFVGMLDPNVGRVVNVGSGSGPMWMSKQPQHIQRTLSSPQVSWEQIESVVANEFHQLGVAIDQAAYGMSKACLHAYTMLLARQHLSVLCSAISPGFIDTAMTAGRGAKLTPEQGTVSILHCLFGDLAGSGWYYGSDAKRSPLHCMRNPGEHEYNPEEEVHAEGEKRRFVVTNSVRRPDN